MLSYKAWADMDNEEGEVARDLIVKGLLFMAKQSGRAQQVFCYAR